MSRPRPYTEGPSDPPARHSFEMWIRTVMSAAAVASLPVRVTRTTVRHESMYSMRVDGRRDIADVVDRLERCGVRVLDIRAWDRPAASASPGGVPPPSEGADSGGTDR